MAILKERKTDDKIVAKGILLNVEDNGFEIEDVKEGTVDFVTFEALFRDFIGEDINLVLKRSTKEELEVEKD